MNYPKKYIKISILYFSLLIIILLIYWASTITKDLITGSSTSSINSYIQDQGNITVYFCPKDDCEQIFNVLLINAKESINCALYEIDLPSAKELLHKRAKEILVQIVTDNDYLKEFNSSFTKADKYGLMHNKFCIIDHTIVSTGSMNPTENDAHRNNNNLLIIHSKVLAQNYEREFQELWNGIFKKGSPVANPHIMIDKTEIKNYFCPEDHCAYHAKEELKKAEKSIFFMTFSFTHDEVANILLLQHLNNITIRGIFDVTQISKDSVFHKLVYNNIPSLKDGNKYKLHHKVFIIDNRTVITGSFNPTKNGDERNDENVLIIDDVRIAQQFMEEFNNLWIIAENKKDGDKQSSKEEKEETSG